MADGFGQVQRHDLSVAFCFFNPRDYTDLLKWTQQNIDRETQRKLLKTGVMGYLWGATLLQSRKVGYGCVYILADAEFLGVIPERIPLTVMSADRPDLRQIGFSIFENLGSWCSTRPACSVSPSMVASTLPPTTARTNLLVVVQPIRAREIRAPFSFSVVLLRYGTITPLSAPPRPVGTPRKEMSISYAGKAPVTETEWRSDILQGTQKVFLCDLHLERSKTQHGRIWQRVK